MPTLEELVKWGTFAGAVVGAITGSLTYWAKVTEKRDRIKVTFGAMRPPTAPGDGMYILSKSDHAVSLVDFGFIDRSGNLLSLPHLWEHEFDDESDGVMTSGSTRLEKRGDIYEVCYQRLRDEQIGAYALAAGQWYRRIGFYHGLRWWHCCYLRLKIASRTKWQ